MFCKNCNNSLGIVKLSHTSTSKNTINIVTVEDLQKLYKENYLIFIETNVKIENKLELRKKLDNLKNDKEKYIEFFNILLDINKNKTFFSCNICNNINIIKPGKKIYEMSYITKTSKFQHDPELLIKNPILARTKDFICINEKCDSNKNDKDNKLKKEAVLYKDLNTNTLYYICCSCKQFWNPYSTILEKKL